ncbi:transposase [Kitasatospora sp. NPDC017646]|uniref:transposase n=1 Tax=Kitasatospora sp. NPDC017646 TaxID=3364024 RepID=UPI003791FB42
MTTTIETPTLPPAADSARALLPYEPQSASAARRLVRTTLRAWGRDDLVEVGELIVSELAGNAAKTGCRRKMTVTGERITERCVRISVRDGSRSLPCLIDSGYPCAELVTAAAGEGITMITPLLADHSAQARAAEGFDKSAFRIDWTARQVRCPESRTSTGWYPVQQHGHDAIVIEFARADCSPCPSRRKCTTAARGNRMLTLRPRELHETVAAARAEQKTDTWQAKYALRAGIEGTINQALDATGLRRARYRGLPKVSLQHAYSATAINVIRLDAHWTDQARRPRTSRLTRLAHQLAA